MYSALDISSFVLNEFKKEDQDITHLKLQKLLYYIQGANLAFKDEPLFSEQIEHWDNGPVVRKVYDRHKDCSWNPITEFSEPAQKIAHEDAVFIQSVLERYWDEEAEDLRDKTHQEKPWLETKKNQEISVDLLSKFFKEDVYGDVLTGKIFDIIPVE